MPSFPTLVVYTGENFRPTFTMDPVEDISGWTIVLTVKAKHDTAVLLTKNATLTVPLEGEYQFTLTAAETDGLTTGNYVYDIWRTNANSESLLAIGNFTVKPSVR